MTNRYLIYDSPIGQLLLVATANGLTAIEFELAKRKQTVGSDWEQGGSVVERAQAQLIEYFEGARRIFELPLSPEGTEFQRRVWAELSRIPYGVTVSYGEIASRIGSPTASRAVGAANGRNPIPIVIPCHRVIGKSGALTGFGGGLTVKQRLLELEDPGRLAFP